MPNTTQLYLPLEAPDYGPIRDEIYEILSWNIEYDNWMHMYSFPTTNWGQANSSMINAEDHDLNFSLFSLHIARVFKGFKASPESRGLSWEGLRSKTTLRLNPYYNLPFQNDPVSGQWTQCDHLNIDQCQRNKYEPDPVTDAWI